MYLKKVSVKKYCVIKPGPEPGQKNFKTRNPARKILKPRTRPGTRVSGLGRKTRPGPEFFGNFLDFFSNEIFLSCLL